MILRKVQLSENGEKIQGNKRASMFFFLGPARASMVLC
jgi:hypothetical protein